MQALTLREIQKIELDILSDIDRFCRENGIGYSLDGGTLLGAVRHHGFIPWDDDIDIIMPREDYDRFVKTYHSENGRYVLYSKDTNPPYRTQLFAKVIDTRTIADEGQYKRQVAYGLWVDIFPADHIPVDDRLCRRIQKRFLRYRHLLYVRNLKQSQKSLRDVVFSALYLFRSDMSVLRSLDRYAAKADSSGRVTNLSMVSDDLIGFHFPAAWFEDLTEYPFEGRRFLGFAAYDRYLTEVYGDYMTLPPIEQRETHFVTAFWRE